MIVDHIMMYDINKIHFQPKLKFFQIFYENRAMILSEKRASKKYQKQCFPMYSGIINSVPQVFLKNSWNLRKPLFQEISPR